MKQHSKIAWEVASKFSHALASETRDLAGWIDATLADERERCAKVAVAHKGSYQHRPFYKELVRGAGNEALLEIRAEERGEDIASEMIAKAIRAL